MVSNATMDPPGTKDLPVARKKTGAVLLGAELHRKALLVASFEGLSIGDLVISILQPVIEERYRRMHEEMAREFEEPKKPRKSH